MFRSQRYHEKYFRYLKLEENYRTRSGGKSITYKVSDFVAMVLSVEMGVQLSEQNNFHEWMSEIKKKLEPYGLS